MNKQTYYALVSIIFGVLAVLHAARLYYQWEAVIGGVEIPIWVSWFALIIAGYLAMRGWMFVQKKGR
ncbi:MAG: hypothetical protein AAB449_02135 [Patescibacteria group bacterium]